MTDLPEIPVIQNADNPLVLFHQETDRAKALIKVCQASLPGFVLGFLANKTRLWLNETQPPYKEELDEIAETLGQSAYSLNLSYEWGCTTTARNDDRNGGVQMYRALDWPITNMADKLVGVEKSRMATRMLVVQGIPACSQGRNL